MRTQYHAFYGSYLLLNNFLHGYINIINRLIQLDNRVQACIANNIMGLITLQH